MSGVLREGDKDLSNIRPQRPHPSVIFGGWAAMMCSEQHVGALGLEVPVGHPGCNPPLGQTYSFI